MKTILAAALLLACTTSSAQVKYSITGDVSGVRDTVVKVYLNYRAKGEFKVDSTTVAGNKYSFSGVLEEPSQASIIARYKNMLPAQRPMRRDMASIILDNSRMTILHVDTFSNAKVQGSKANDSYQALNAKMKPVTSEIEKLNNKYRDAAKNNDKEAMKALESEFDGIDAKQKAVYKEFFLSDPSSPIAPMVLSQYAGWDVNADDVEPLFVKLSQAGKNSPTGKELAEKIATAKLTGIGRTAPEFTQNDTSGNPVSLASLRGKYLLIDFWASWCGPCRRENPNVVAAFQKYKDKGFTILGVSLDRENDKDKWIKAIHDDKLTWMHVSDLKYFKNAVAVQYGIQAIPQNFLLDPSGKIVAKNLRGEDLDKKLGEFLH